MPESAAPPPVIPEARAVPKKRTRLSAVWIVPAIAAVVGVWIAVTRILGQGPTITIVFNTAEGLEAGKTQIHYNGVTVGTLTTLRLSDNHENVIATAQMAPKTEGFLVDDTQFWVVSPRISGANVSGLGTLISGAYVGMEIGKSNQPKRSFVALTAPPVVTGDVVGRFFQLKTPNLGSLDTGTPIYFRRLQVGQVASYALDKDGAAITLKVFVQAPYDQYVNPNTRFWQASGIDVSMTASGINVQTQSVLSILVGGIAFETPTTGPVLSPAEENTEYPLFANRADAFKLTAREPQTYVLVFTDSVRGLAPGAPVQFRGIPVGDVAEVTAQLDYKTFQFTAPVTIRLDPFALGVQMVDLGPDVDRQALRRRFVDSLIAHGVRAQLQTGSLLTGALFVEFDFFPDAAPATVDWTQSPAQLPTVPGEVQALEARISNIVRKLDEVPFKAIGNDVQDLLEKLDAVPYKKIGDDLAQSIVTLNQTLDSAKSTLNNADKLVEPSSVLSQELSTTLQEVSRAARGLRVLADYLERHPEALLRGKTGEAN